MRRESSGVFDLKVSGATGICLKRTIYHNTSLSYFLFGKTKGTEKTHVEYEIQSGSGRQNWKPVELKAFTAGQISSTQQLVIFKWLKKPQPNHYFILRILKQYDLKLWNISIDDWHLGQLPSPNHGPSSLRPEDEKSFLISFMPGTLSFISVLSEDSSLPKGCFLPRQSWVTQH